MLKIHWKYVSCGCHSTLHFQISTLFPYYVQSLCVTFKKKEEKKPIDNTRHQVDYTCDTFDSTIWLSLPTAVKHPSSHPHVLYVKVFHWRLPPFDCGHYTVLHRPESKRVELLFFLIKICCKV